ncbi:MAG TPA: ATP synthase F0 subunit C [Anaerolineae bacterium]|nr:ATP synthase F0 subunit C [Anaerolineae bacterium]
MDAEAVKLLAAALSVGLGAIGPGIGIGIVASGALQSIARNPDVSGEITTNMFIGIAFSEALAIFGLVICLILLFVV